MNSQNYRSLLKRHLIPVKEGYGFISWEFWQAVCLCVIIRNYYMQHTGNKQKVDKYDEGQILTRSFLVRLSSLLQKVCLKKVGCGPDANIN